jgi:hypothetical protein
MKNFKCKPLKNVQFTTDLATDVSPQQYRWWESTEIPKYLSSSANPLGRYHNNCVLIIAAEWNKKESLGKYRPKGIGYYILTFRDDLNKSGQQELNKDCRFVFLDSSDEYYTVHLFDPNDHAISAVAMGTSMPRLKKVFRLPPEKSGPIEDLIKANSSIWPYKPNHS